MKMISTNTKGRSGYQVFSTCHQTLFQVSAESAAAESHTATDALPLIRTAGIKACLEQKGEVWSRKKGYQEEQREHRPHQNITETT